MQLEEIAPDATHHYRIIAELTSDFGYCFLVAPEGGLVLEWMSHSVTRLLGYTVEDINRMGWQSFLYDEDVFVVIQHWQRLLAGETDVAEFRIHGENRKLMWVRNYARPIWDERRQQIKYIYGAAQDITARKEADQQIAALNARLQFAMKESFHRIKNNLQLVATLIDVQAMDHQGALPAERVAQLSAQIRTLAAVHNLLTQGVRADGQTPFVSTKVLLGNLCALLQAMAGHRKVQYQVEDIPLPQRQGTSLALIVNELVQNALRHGKGQIQIRLEAVLSQIRLQVWDEGDGFSVPCVSDAEAHLGIQLVEDLTASDLKGQVCYQNRPEGGAQAVVLFPLPRMDEPVGIRPPCVPAVW